MVLLRALQAAPGATLALLGSGPYTAVLASVLAATQARFTAADETRNVGAVGTLDLAPTVRVRGV